VDILDKGECTGKVQVNDEEHDKEDLSVEPENNHVE